MRQEPFTAMVPADFLSPKVESVGLTLLPETFCRTLLPEGVAEGVAARRLLLCRCGSLSFLPLQ